MDGDDDTLDGYMEGLRSDLDELPQGSNRSEMWKHGWRNGRDDRMSRPRASAREIRRMTADIETEQASYL